MYDLSDDAREGVMDYLRDKWIRPSTIISRGSGVSFNEIAPTSTTGTSGSTGALVTYTLDRTTSFVITSPIGLDGSAVTRSLKERIPVKCLSLSVTYKL